jgi:hypothetical protein
MEYLIYFLISMLLSILLKPDLEGANPPSKSDLKVPTNDPQRNISVAFGQVRIRACAILWSGDNVTYTKITKKVKTGFGMSDNVTIGYQTFVSMAVSLGFGKVFLSKIYFNDEVGMEVTDPLINGNSGFFDVDAETIFLNENDEASKNGVKGNVIYYDGTQTVADSHIENQQGVNEISPLKGLSYAVFENFYWGNTTTLSTPDFEIIRIPKLIDGVGGLIDNGDGTYDANPINILYDIITENQKYGIAVEDAKIDIESFKTAALALEAEGFGISLIFENGANFEDIKKDIQKHCSVNIFLSPYTGLWTTTLNRNNYVVNELPIFNKSNIKSIKYSRTQPSSLFSEMKVNYIDRNKDYVENSVLAKSLSIENIRGNANTQKDTFNACKNQTLAAKIAQREMLGYNKPLAKLELLTNRDSYGLRIGDVIVVNYDDYNINQGIFRVIEMDLGKFNDNKIKVNLIEDIFSFGDAAISELGESKWSRPRAEDYLYYTFTDEAPIFWGTNNNILACVTDHNTRSKGFELHIDEGQKLLQEAIDNTTPNSIISHIGYSDTSITILATREDTKYNLDRLVSETEGNRKNGDNMAVIARDIDQSINELISFESVTYNQSTNTYTLNNVWRGLLDTTPKKWRPFNQWDDTFLYEDQIFFLSYANIVNNLDITNTLGTAITYDLERTMTNAGNLVAINDGVITFDRRVDKPFPPYAVKVNGNLMDNEIGLQDQLDLTWSGSNKSSAILNVTHFAEESYSNEPNTTYNLKIGTFDFFGGYVPLREVLGLTDKFYSYIDEIGDGGYYAKLKIEIETVRDGTDLAHEIFEIIIDRVEKIIDITIFSETSYAGTYSFSTVMNRGFSDSLIFSNNNNLGIDILKSNNKMEDISLMSLYDTIPIDDTIVKSIEINDIYYLFYENGQVLYCIVYDYFAKTHNVVNLGSGQIFRFVHYNASENKIFLGRKANLNDTVTFTSLSVDGFFTVTDEGTTTTKIGGSISINGNSNGDLCYYNGRYFFAVNSGGGVRDIYSYDASDFTETLEATYTHSQTNSASSIFQITEWGTCLILAGRTGNQIYEYFQGSDPTSMVSREITVLDTLYSITNIFYLVDDGSCCFFGGLSVANYKLYFSTDFITFDYKNDLTAITGINSITKDLNKLNITGTTFPAGGGNNIKNYNYNTIY